MAKSSEVRLASGDVIRHSVSFQQLTGGTSSQTQCRVTQAASTPRIDSRKMISEPALVVRFKPGTFQKLRVTPTTPPALQLMHLHQLARGASVQAAAPSRQIGRSRVDAHNGRTPAIRSLQKR
jgi:hypothetical protein